MPDGVPQKGAAPGDAAPVCPAPVRGFRALPIDTLLPEILASLSKTPNLVLEAAPGAGKTTRVPAAMLAMFPGQTLVLEPRRIAARLAARRVAAEMGEEPGESVGYQVRFETVGGPRTRLHFLTEGVLTRRLLSDPYLRGVDAVVLDEFHERHLDGDLALALLKRLQKQRPDLRIVVMSATLDGKRISEYLGECRLLRSEGRAFPVSVEHLPYPSSAPLHEQVRSSMERLLSEGQEGHTLVFLPGSAEIRRAQRECEMLARREELLVLPLYGDLSAAEQDRVFAPSRQRKLILSTNLAESSVTIDGITAVIDSGLARISGSSPWTGLPTLHVGRISKASAQQRAGRAGRTAPGRVLRLYAEAEMQLRPEHDIPEILRSDLSQMLLTLRVLENVADREAGSTEGPEWLDAPPAAAVEHAERLLDRLGATGEAASALTRYPLPPRLARMVEEGVRRGAGEEVCLAAALLSSGARSASTDLLTAIDEPLDGRTFQTARQLMRLAGVRRSTADRRTEGLHASHGGAAIPPPHHGDQTKSSAQKEEALLLAVLAGFPDRVARRRSGREVALANGSPAELAEPQHGSRATAVPEFLVAMDAEDRKDRPLPLIRMAAHVEADWLLDLFPERVREERNLLWNRDAERVEAHSVLLYDALVLDESRLEPGLEEAMEMLAEKAVEAGVDRFVQKDAMQNLLARIRFAGLPAPNAEGVLRTLCMGLRSFAELRKVMADAFLPMLEDEAGGARLRELAPATLRLPGGRQTKVHYEEDRSPWIASRLQDFFGMRETPHIGPGKTSVVVHLLAPNQRAVQTTTDLAGFWERLYPEVRRELMRRYPRHAWPERP